MQSPHHHNPAPGDDAIREALAAALAAQPGGPAITADAVRPLPQKGIAHRHYRLAGTAGWLARVPKVSQFSLAAGDNLTYQAACFDRAAASGHTPRLHHLLAPTAGLPMGALVIDFIAGAPLRLAHDMAAVARCLAQVHGLPMPAPAARPPLADHTDPVAGTLAFIEDQARHIDAAVPVPEVRRALAEELAWARRFAGRVAGRAQPRALVLSDTHPGNFLRAGDGKAWFVDLEKALYGAPAVDLAHASLLTSTTWDIAAHGVLDRDAVMAFYGAYLAAVPAERAAALRPWLNDMRRLTWLRTTTWSCKWAATRPAAANGNADETAGTADAADRTLRAHIAERLRNFTAPETVARCRAEWLDSDPLDLARA